MNLFQKDRSEKTNAKAFALMRAIELHARKFSAALTEKSERLSTRTKIILLIVGVIIGAYMSLSMIVRGLSGESPISAKPAHIQMMPTPREDQDVLPLISVESYKKLRLFRRICDSLAQTSEGQTQLHEMLKGRPGLLDSVDVLITEYEIMNSNSTHKIK